VKGRVYTRRKYDVGGGEKLTAQEVADRVGLTLSGAQTRLAAAPQDALRPHGRVPRRDLSNEKFDKLTAVALVAYQIVGARHRMPVYACRCACGGPEILVPYDKLVGRRKTSCGCGTAPAWKGDLVGATRGYLKVLRCMSDKPTRQALYECLCVCGNTCERRGTTLMLEERSSCGCKRWEAHGKAMAERRRTVEVFGEKLSLAELVEVSGLHEATLRKRMDKRGMSPEEAAFGESSAA